jgi:hypothetical protein
MIKQTLKAGDMAAAIAPLRTLTELGDAGTGRPAAATDLTPRSVHPGWYDRYWYGDRPQSKWTLLANVVCRLCGEVLRLGETLRGAIARATSGLIQGWRAASSCQR